MAVDVAVLVSVGRHPASARARRAPSDARALELALGIPDARIHLLHAGDPGEAVLREYLGMGVSRMEVLEIPPEADAAAALVAHLQGMKPDLVLCGARAEHGTSSGQLPYAVARGLGYPIVPAAAALELLEGRVRIAQALPRGQRRGISAPLPVLLTVDRAAPAPRQSAWAAGRRGKIETVQPAAVPVVQADWVERPARKRPKRLKVMAGGTAAERLKAASQMQAGKGRLMVRPDPDEAARAVYEYLVEEGILKG